MPEAPVGPVSSFRLFGLLVGAVFAAALATGLTVLVVSPPISGDAGHVSLFWLVLFFGVLAEGGRIIFGTYLAAALVGIFVYVHRRKAR